MNLFKPHLYRIPVYVITGFLGSGKTTLLNNLLRQLPRSAVIINEFGSTPIDQQLLREHNILISTLSGGCLCCQVRDALGPVLKNLRMAWEGKEEKPFDRIIIETSGVANPEPVLDVLLKQNWISKRYNLQSAIATISAPSGIDTLGRFPEAQAQIAWADTVLITHSDLADDFRVHSLNRRLAELSPTAQVLRVINGNVDTGRLLALPMKLPYRDGNPTDDLPGHSFNSMSFHFEQPLPWRKLEPVLRTIMAKYADTLVRMKGIIFDPDFDNPLLIQGSIDVLHSPAHLPTRASDDSISRLVFIAADGIDALNVELNAALSEFR